jgi:hypothetical protein
MIRQGNLPLFFDMRHGALHLVPANRQHGMACTPIGHMRSREERELP